MSMHWRQRKWFPRNTTKKKHSRIFRCTFAHGCCFQFSILLIKHYYFCTHTQKMRNARPIQVTTNYTDNINTIYKLINTKIGHQNDEPCWNFKLKLLAIRWFRQVFPFHFIFISIFCFSFLIVISCCKLKLQNFRCKTVFVNTLNDCPLFSTLQSYAKSNVRQTMLKQKMS